MPDRWTASTSTYPTRSRRRGQQVRRAHLIPPDGTFPARGVPDTTACGQPWWHTSNADNADVPLGGPLPDGITWCPKCLGVAAEQLGLTRQLASLIAHAAQETVP